MKKLLLVSVMLLSLNVFSQTTKYQRYEIYKANCYDVDTVVIQISGYLKIDTVVLASIPVKPTYYGKVILSSIKMSPTRSLIVTVDTVWNNLKTPTYAFGNPSRTIIPLEYNKTSQRVFKNKRVIIKLCKPVSYTIWTKNELYYKQLLATIKTNLNL